jgi:hypothetical protein
MIRPCFVESTMTLVRVLDPAARVSIEKVVNTVRSVSIPKIFEQ